MKSDKNYPLQINAGPRIDKNTVRASYNFQINVFSVFWACSYVISCHIKIQKQ